MNRVEVEKLVLGSLVNNKTLFFDIAGLINPKMFTDHREAWAAKIWERLLNGEGIEYHTIYQLTDDKTRPELDEIYFELANNEGVSFAGELKEIFFTQSGISILHTAQSELQNGQPFTQVFTQLENDYEALTKQTALEKDKDSYDRAIERLKNPNSAYNVKTGFPKLDKLTGGWPSGMIVIAARAKMGKTTLAIWHIIHALRQGKSVLFYSYEMSSEQILRKIGCYWAGYNSNDESRLNDKQRDEVVNAILEIKELPLYIVDPAKFSGYVEDLETQVKIAKLTKGIDMAVVDYIQLFSSYKNKRGYTNREQEVSTVSKTISKTALNCNIPILALAQISREAERRGGSMRPRLSDIRESGSIEQDAFMVMLPYRPAYYNIMEDEEGRSLANVTEYIISASRADGSLRNKAIDLYFDASTGAYSDEEKESFDFEQSSVINPIHATNTTEDLPF